MLGGAVGSVYGGGAPMQAKSGTDQRGTPFCTTSSVLGCVLL